MESYIQVVDRAGSLLFICIAKLREPGQINTSVIRNVVNCRSPILRPHLSAVSDSSSAVEGPAKSAGVAGDHLPPLATLSPDVHHVEVAALVLTIAARLLRQQKTECREIIGQLASGVVALLQRLNLIFLKAAPTWREAGCAEERPIHAA